MSLLELRSSRLRGARFFRSIHFSQYRFCPVVNELLMNLVPSLANRQERLDFINDLLFLPVKAQAIF